MATIRHWILMSEKTHSRLKKTYVAKKTINKLISY